jgi:hypothetical protein
MRCNLICQSQAGIIDKPRMSHWPPIQTGAHMAWLHVKGTLHDLVKYLLPVISGPIQR